MFASDIGMNHIEEINIVREGRNYGWMKREAYFENGVTRPGGTLNQLYPLPADVLEGRQQDEFTYPVAIYDHDEGRAVSGGFAYYGRIAALRGKFVFGDVQRGRLFAADLSAMKKADDGIPQTVAPVEEIQLYIRDRGWQPCEHHVPGAHRPEDGAEAGSRRHAHRSQQRRRALRHVEAGRHDPDARAVAAQACVRLNIEQYTPSDDRGAAMRKCCPATIVVLVLVLFGAPLFLSSRSYSRISTMPRFRPSPTGPRW
jgi:hypothetical protein